MVLHLMVDTCISCWRNKLINTKKKLSDNLILLKPVIFSDERGWFYEAFKENGTQIQNKFIQDNHSYSRLKGTIRGLHIQLPPYQQAKIIRVLKGKILDVVLDLRPTSMSYLKFDIYELDSIQKNALFIPKGFAHGFITIEDDTEVYYKVDEIYSKEHELTIKYNDPDLSIEWPAFEKYFISEKDNNGLSLNDVVHKLEGLE